MDIIILSGISGSGKSTYARGIANGIVVSADTFFMQDGEYRFNPAKLGEAHGECLKAFVEAARAYGKRNYEVEPTLVVDNTNTTVVELAPYVSVAAAYGHRTTLITFECDPGVAAARNRHGVSFEGCSRQYANLASRKIPPFWKVAYKVVRDGQLLNA